MAAITVNNIESNIIANIITQLTNATISGTAVFSKVAETDNYEGGKQKEFTDSACALVVYESTDEHPFADLLRGNVCNLTLILAQKTASSATRRAAVINLANAARDAIFGTPPTDSKAFMSGDELFDRVSFRDVELDMTSNKPWGVALLPCSISYHISSVTSH
jgi:hypothetical protein